MSVNTRPSDFRDGTAAHKNYRPNGRAEVQPKMPFSPYTGLGQALYPRAFPASTGRHKAQGRWREYGILLGIWLLVVLVAGVIGTRFLDLSAGPDRPDAHGRASAAPATPASPPALSAPRTVAEEDPFDDPPIGLPPVPATITTPTASAAAALQVSSNIAFKAQPPANPASAPAAVPDVTARLEAAREKAASPGATRVPAACAPALSAMQLCGETEK